MLTMYIIGGLFIFLGIGIKYFKWSFLIAGYNTMSKKDKENVDVDKLSILMGNFMMGMGVLILGAGLAEKMGYRLLMLILLFSIFPLSIIPVILAQKYDHNKNNRSRKMEAKFICWFLILPTLAVSILLAYGIRDPRVTIMEDRIVISGIYGTALARDKIEEISLEEDMPRVIKKVNGFDLAYSLRGIFNLEDLGRGSLYLRANKPPYILIKTDKNYFLINYKDREKTIDLYEKLK